MPLEQLLLKRRYFLWAALVLLLLASGGVFASPPGSGFTGHDFSRGTNAAWLDVDWVMVPHEDREIMELADDLGRREISHVFAYVSYLKEDGQFNSTYSHAAEFVRIMKAAQPSLNVQAWIGLPLRSGGESASGHVDLRDSSTREDISRFSSNIVRWGGFDGVHFDPEPVRNGDKNVLLLLDQVRGAIGADVDLSIATRRIQPAFSQVSFPFADRWVWGAKYYREVANRVDQIAVMTYDSGLPSPELYRYWTQRETVELTRALDGWGGLVFIGVPTSEETTGTHSPNAENITSGLLGVIDGLNQLDSLSSVVSGVAIYPYWETDSSEWSAYDSLWLGRRPAGKGQ